MVAGNGAPGPLVRRWRRITMRIRTALSEDTTSAALNTKAHAPEHCAIDRESLDVINSAVGRPVLVMRSAKWLALYTVAARIDVARPAARVGTVGLVRVEDPTGEPPAPKLRAALETDFLGGDSSARACVASFYAELI
jgi:hypothetical protein